MSADTEPTQDERREVNLNNFIDSHMLQMRDFACSWKDNHNENPDDYPMQMLAGDWYEMFFSWLESESLD